MSADKRVGWLADVRVGETIGAWVPSAPRTARMVQVDKITPTGRITVGDMHFAPNGSQPNGGYRALELIPEAKARKIIAAYREWCELAQIIEALKRGMVDAMTRYDKVPDVLPHLRAARDAAGLVAK